jgi:hypothetical protein
MQGDFFGGPNEATEVDDNKKRALSSLRAEFLVAAEIVKQGFPVVHTNQAGYDLVVENGRAHRVNVKSSTQGGNGKLTFMVKKDILRPGQWHLGRPINGEDCDVIALYHYALDRTMFIAAGAICSTSLTIPRPQFLELSSAGIARLIGEPKFAICL